MIRLAEQKSVKEIGELELIRLVGQNSNKGKEVISMMKATAVKSAGQEFFLGCLVTEAHQDIHKFADLQLEALEELEERFNARSKA